MSDPIDKLKKPPALMVPGCSTCRHLWGRSMNPFYWRCGVQGGERTDPVYGHGWTTCRGNLWEPQPPPVPVLVRFKRWLVG